MKWSICFIEFILCLLSKYTNLWHFKPKNTKNSNNSLIPLFGTIFKIWLKLCSLLASFLLISMFPVWIYLFGLNVNKIYLTIYFFAFVNSVDKQIRSKLIPLIEALNKIHMLFSICNLFFFIFFLDFHTKAIRTSKYSSNFSISLHTLWI